MKTLVIVMMFIIPMAQANPLADLKPVGETSLNWLWWKIYDIRLLTKSGYYSDNNSELALVIQYARDINSTQLISTTIEEWDRQNIVWLPEWIKTLNRIWPDVSTGDEIILKVDNQRHSHFYLNQQLIGSIKDAEFTLAFLSIWLSDNSRNLALTRQLTGTF